MSDRSGSGGLGGLETAMRGAKGGPASWNPAFCGAIDMRIAADGTWFYLGTPIGRKPLVKLFSSVLRHEDAYGYVLVTPVEKVAIAVDDAPFLAVEMVRDGGDLRFRTNVDDWVTAGPDHPLRFQDSGDGVRKPYLTVRPRLEALVARAVFYDLIELSEERDGVVGVASAGAFFPIASAAEFGAAA